MQQHEASPARVRPGLIPALIVFAIYLVSYRAIGELVGGDVKYTELADSIDNFRDGVAIPVGIAAVIVAAMTSYLGWWRPVLFEARTAPTWLIVWPVLSIAVMIGNIAGDADQWDADFLAMLLVGFAFVGFTEELATRGVLLTGARGQYREVWAWLISTGCFGAMHSLNALDGQDVGATANQVVVTFGIGTLFYFARRITGTLFVSMALHMLYDAALTIHGGPGAEFSTDVGTPAWGPYVFMVSGAIFLLVALITRSLRRENPGPEIEPLMASATAQSA
ncbi:MAG: CPBP family intramembrane glutamic endopeptidase [Microthrixaceae bacterium]